MDSEIGKVFGSINVWGVFMYLLLVVSGDEVVLSKIGIIFTLKVNFSFISATVLAEVAHSVQFCR